jgi:hypothetical protein
MLVAIGTGLLFLGYLLTRLFNRPAASVAGTTEQVKPLAPVLATVIEQQSQEATASATLTEANAGSVIESWLAAKADALGEAHEIDRLSEVLAEPALSSWQERAEQLEASDSYWLYEHSPVEVLSVETIADEDTPTGADPAEASSPEASSSQPPDSSAAEDTTEAASAAIVEATVTEKGEFYDNGQLDQSSSYESTLQVQYNLIREGDQWRIQDWQVVE